MFWFGGAHRHLNSRRKLASMSLNSTADNLCAPDDHLCIVREHLQAVIIVPTLLLLSTLVGFLAICCLRYCPERKGPKTTSAPRYHSASHKQRHSHRNHLQGIDAPPGINPLEHEELPMSVQQVQQNVRPTLAAVPPMSTERQRGAFSQMTALQPSFPVTSNNTYILYRARKDNRDVILRMLKETANGREKQEFLGFAAFVSGLGPHPFLPELLGVVSVQPPLMMVVEELQHRDLLGYLWKCRQQGNSGSESSCEMTEKKIFTMAGQVASALEYLHGQRCIHGNVGSRSVLVGGDLTAKLWGFGSAYRRRTQAVSPGEVGDIEMRKWQAPEVLGGKADSQSSDIWSFGILLYEMVTLGDPPFAEYRATELLQYLQRGKHLKRPTTCSNSLYSIIKNCSHWRPEHRLSTSELIRTLQSGEKSANGRKVLKVTQPLDIEKYLREAGYGEAYDFAVL
ncbi:tyrosine-protein kinase STYK1-like isoform X1 [Notothenia coriiceps]|uniref:Tyrosine-protein kinase STYK1-like isoform X1 n=2 Tax=Notothenia coriiceps TaxID=8208 RepID=A0A6I9PDR4_9TELE|nr:PREDICTED: tyrosine-protein kinase STYK1-like isoform X1 [Notothenia coriiceps]